MSRDNNIIQLDISLWSTQSHHASYRTSYSIPLARVTKIEGYFTYELPEKNRFYKFTATKRSDHRYEITLQGFQIPPELYDVLCPMIRNNLCPAVEKEMLGYVEKNKDDIAKDRITKDLELKNRIKEAADMEKQLLEEEKENKKRKRQKKSTVTKNKKEKTTPASAVAVPDDNISLCSAVTTTATSAGSASAVAAIQYRLGIFAQDDTFNRHTLSAKRHRNGSTTGEIILSALFTMPRGTSLPDSRHTFPPGHRCNPDDVEAITATIKLPRLTS
ncbi:MAG: hypothetical protein A3C44_06150 [Gammaproteobacteria bacterium RIFCSPHIGHO2_02_FULL_39_13]|nr:MAG: hypothetical protein A3C44_06150 [Gammaproteobacteria bacterium RIFCSPHIGHO2_02_FULL_39_13]OGT49266.1 MAG: hypothetical protein A3E53_07390 [Gammaproteobacteria bacterium RIFCSPHIGHO2_12_FULL_39_24]